MAEKKNGNSRSYSLHDCDRLTLLQMFCSVYPEVLKIKTDEAPVLKTPRMPRKDQMEEEEEAEEKGKRKKQQQHICKDSVVMS